MKILTGKQIKEVDLFTIENEPIESLELMERAAEVIAQWICNNVDQQSPLIFFVGKGNNGGDGLAVARMLYHVGYNCSVVTVLDRSEMNEECRYNFERLPENILIPAGNLLDIAEDSVIVDAILGTGVRGEVTEPLRNAIELINGLPNRKISIDIPSGMKTEFGNNDLSGIVQADTTLTLEFPKLAMLLPEAGECCGEIVVLPIELDQSYIESILSPYNYLTEDFVAGLLLPRAKFAHKGTYGHALLICGSEGMIGAATLATGAALRSGCGLVTTHVPKEERYAIQANHPSAILSLDPANEFSVVPDNLDRFASIGVGCGLGRTPYSVAALEKLFKNYSKPFVVDADALNNISQHTYLQQYISAGSILTPHIGELRCMIGEWSGVEEMIDKTLQLSSRLGVVVVVKGSHSMICMPDGAVYFNSTGNSGMAKGGSGDVLTGFITGLLARGYTSEAAAVVGVYMHGLAGDKAADYFGVEGMNGSDIIDFLAEALSDFK